MIDNLKPYGAFVENTMRPFLREVQSLINQLKESGVELNEGKIIKILRTAYIVHISTMAFNLVAQASITAMLCLTVLKVMK